MKVEDYNNSQLKEITNNKELEPDVRIAAMDELSERGSGSGDQTSAEKISSGLSSLMGSGGGKA